MSVPPPDTTDGSLPTPSLPALVDGKAIARANREARKAAAAARRAAAGRGKTADSDDRSDAPPQDPPAASEPSPLRQQHMPSPRHRRPSATAPAAAAPANAGTAEAPIPARGSATSAHPEPVLGHDTTLVTTPGTTDEAPPAPANVQVAPQSERWGQEPPGLILSVDDPAALLPVVVQLNIADGTVMARFRRAADRKGATFTSLVLDALRQHQHELATLVARRRPHADPNDLFPHRAPPRSAPPVPGGGVIRTRPTVGELKIIDALVARANEQIVRGRLGVRPVSRSELVTAALDGYLPKPKPRSGDAK
jgi:hypothetical protein